MSSNIIQIYKLNVWQIISRYLYFFLNGYSILNLVNLKDRNTSGTVNWVIQPII